MELAGGVFIAVGFGWLLLVLIGPILIAAVVALAVCHARGTTAAAVLERRKGIVPEEESGRWYSQKPAALPRQGGK